MGYKRGEVVAAVNCVPGEGVDAFCSASVCGAQRRGGLCCPRLTFKRGMIGVYQHCGEAHLHRYLAEFDFRYNNRIALGIDDAARADAALKGIKGKRLTYRRTDEAPHA